MGKFDKFNSMVNMGEVDSQKEEIKKSGGVGNFPSVPSGTYPCEISKLVLGECGANAKMVGAPLLKVDMVITDGEYKKQHIFMNKVMVAANETERWNTAKAIAQVLGFLESLKTGVEIEFKDFDQFEDVVMDVEEACANYEYDVNYDEDAFFSIVIEDVYEK